ncbi:MAG: FAD-binding protein [Gammaproteobacteria bacterium]|nr:FAD-binding protein [Gammaproteobacteria bacterium]
MTQALALQQLSSALPPDRLISKEFAKRPYETDGLTAYREVPWLVALPRNTNEVRQILRICNECSVPVVTRGAGTGLSGGARPLKEGLLLVLSRMKRILEVDFDACTATVEPGVTNLSISQEVQPYGLYYAPDPSSQIACSIGGNVAENSGGVHCLKYGLTLHNVTGLVVQTIDGDELVLGGKSYESPGLDLLPLITGSEGLLGVVTQVTVKLLPQPTNQAVLLGAFDSIESAGNCVSAIIATGIIPAALEMMDSLAIKASEEFAHCGYPIDAEAILLCELDGTKTTLDQDLVRIREVLDDYDVKDFQIATDAESRELLWRGRKSAFPAAGRIATDYYCMDGTIPRKHIGYVLRTIKELGESYGLGVANVFHAGDGNLHPLILYDASKPDEIERSEQFGMDILNLCVKVGGTVTGEHGIGVEKLDAACSQFTDHELEQFFRVKQAFDRQGIMNPGKAIPTLTRCSELGGMHVHNGEVPFPEIPRF